MYRVYWSYDINHNIKSTLKQTTSSFPSLFLNTFQVLIASIQGQIVEESDNVLTASSFGSTLWLTSATISLKSSLWVRRTASWLASSYLRLTQAEVGIKKHELFFRPLKRQDHMGFDTTHDHILAYYMAPMLGELIKHLKFKLLTSQPAPRRPDLRAPLVEV